jgi:hypothetical protein
MLQLLQLFITRRVTMVTAPHLLLLLLLSDHLLLLLRGQAAAGQV